MRPPEPPKKRPRYFYGWNIVFASFLAHLSYAEHHSSVLGFFMRPLNQSFGWSRTEISVVQSIARFVEAGASFFVGPVIDKHGPRLLMPLGAIIVGIAMIVTTQVESIWQFWLLRGVVVAIGFTLMGHMVTNVTINKWFVKKRGRAIAFSGIGSNLGNVIMTPLTVWVLAVYNWQTMFVVFAVATWAMVLLPSLIFMRRQPEDLGLNPDGDDDNLDHNSDDTNETQSNTIDRIWTRTQVLRTPVFWLLTASIAIANLAFQGINISLAPYMQDLNYPDAVVATVVTVRAVFMAAALPAWGVIIEKASSVMIRVIPFALQGCGAYLFLGGENPVFLWLAVATYGTGFAGMMIIQEVLWADYYGRPSLGLVRSTGFPLVFGFSAIGPIFMNGIFDLFGSYEPAYILFIGLYSMSGLFIFLAKHPKPT